MMAVRAIGWLYIAAAVLAAMIGLAEEEMGLLGVGLAGAVAGVLFLAVDRIITLLSEIRDAVRTGADVSRVTTKAEPDPAMPTKTIAELEAALAKARSK